MNKLIKLSCALLIASVTAASTGRCRAAETSLRVAYVDVDRVLRDYKKGDDLYKQIEKDFEPQRKALEQKTKFIQEEQHRMTTDPRMRDKVEYLRKKQQIELKVAELKMDEQKYVKERTEKELGAMMNVWNDLTEAIAKYAKENGLDLVVKQQVLSEQVSSKAVFHRRVGSQTLLYAAKRLDITEALIKQMNTAYERGTGAAKG